MATHSVLARHNRPTNDELHPFIYRAIIGLTIWLVLSIWFLFSRGGYTGLDAGVITFFFSVLVGIPVVLWLSWRNNTPTPMSTTAISRHTTNGLRTRSRPGPAESTAAKQRCKYCCRSPPLPSA